MDLCAEMLLAHLPEKTTSAALLRPRFRRRATRLPLLSSRVALNLDRVLNRFRHLEDIPQDARGWDVALPGARSDRLAGTLKDNWDLALLFRDLATLRANAPIQASPESLRWTGPAPAFGDICAQLGASGLAERVERRTTKVE